MNPRALSRLLCSRRRNGIVLLCVDVRCEDMPRHCRLGLVGLRDVSLPVCPSLYPWLKTCFNPSTDATALLCNVHSPQNADSFEPLWQHGRIEQTGYSRYFFYHCVLLTFWGISASLDHPKLVRAKCIEKLQKAPWKFLQLCFLLAAIFVHPVFYFPLAALLLCTWEWSLRLILPLDFSEAFGFRVVLLLLQVLMLLLTVFLTMPSCGVNVEIFLIG